MACSQCQGIERFFNRRQAERQLAQYQRRGPARTTRHLIEALRDQGVEGSTLLDIGGGIGAIQLELLRAGATHATDVDASSGYLAVARSAAEGAGLASQIEYRAGDFVTLAAELPSADIVTLDRVICCYPDMHGLVGRSAAKAARLYGVVYPRDTWWTRAILGCGNLLLRLQRTSFRVFVHPTEAVDAIARENGLSKRFHRIAGFWQVVVYARSAEHHHTNAALLD
jgi:magnesium-protoporphyrin O-methyltransferase